MKSVLLIGLGRFGRHMAEKLRALHHEVLAVDRDEQRVNDILPLVTNAQIGDSTNEQFIASLGVRNFDLCVVAIGDDFQSSLETTALLKEHGIGYEADDAKTKDSSADDISIADLGLNDRALVALDRAGIHSIDLLRKMTMQDLMSIEGIGKKTATAIKSKLLKNGLVLRKY